MKAVLDLEVNDQITFSIIAVPLGLCECTWEFPYGDVGGFSDRKWVWSLANLEPLLIYAAQATTGHMI